MDQTNVHVGCLPMDIDNVSFAKLFEGTGAVESTRCFVDKMKAFGFVKYATKEDADAVVQSMNGLHYKGTVLTVQIAKWGVRQSEDSSKAGQKKKERVVKTTIENIVENINRKEAQQDSRPRDSPGDCMVVNGLRYVVPYENSRTVSVKPKWIGQTVLDALVATYPLTRKPDEPTEKTIQHWRDEVAGGRVEIRYSPLSREEGLAEQWHWKCVHPDEVLKNTSDQFRITEHVHERIVSWSENDDAFGINILHADEDIVCISKPAGISTHSSTHDDMNNNLTTIAEAALNRGLPHNDPQRRKLRSVNRLDAPVSGAVIFARTGCGMKKFMGDFAEGNIKKTYVARIHGHLDVDSAPQYGSGAKQGEGEEQGMIEVAVPLGKAKHEDRERADWQNGKLCTTLFRVLEHDASQNTTLVECRPRQGRKHQIRAHLSHIGFPIVHDTLYGGRDLEVDSSSAHSHRQLYKDDDKDTLESLLCNPEVRRDWCAKCRWAARAINAGKCDAVASSKTIQHEPCSSSSFGVDENSAEARTKDASEDQAFVAPSIRSGGICLHARRYEFGGKTVEAPLPAWASLASAGG